ncbi:Co/Zn/Cd efflux system component [Salinibacter ruber]|nr:Co/Zn/Cd efflux system component [Salinibacter ruber]
MLLLISITGWLLQVGLSPGVLMGYVIGAVVVLAFSRGLYHRSIVSGGLLLVVALGPVVNGAVGWIFGDATLSLSTAAFMEGTLALSGLGLSVMVARAIYALRREEASESSSRSPRFT